MIDWNTAENELAEALGYAEQDPPKWTVERRTPDEWTKVWRYRKQHQRGQRTEEWLQKKVAEIDAACRARYEAEYPRRPTRRWRLAVNRYLRLRPQIIKAGGLTQKGAVAILEWVSPAAIKARKAKGNRARTKINAMFVEPGVAVDYGELPKKTVTPKQLREEVTDWSDASLEDFLSADPDMTAKDRAELRKWIEDEQR
jgi:hypothetical protein